jgi:hypothetical protein
MRADVALRDAQTLCEADQTIIIDGWLVNASNRGLGQLFYIVEDKTEHENTRRALFLVRGIAQSNGAEMQLADTLAFLAPFGRLSPIEVKIVGKIRPSPEKPFPYMLDAIESLQVMIPKWGYTGYFIPHGIDYDNIGVGQLSPITLIDLLQNKDLFIGAKVKIAGVFTGTPLTRTTPELSYITDRRYLARPPELMPLVSGERISEEFLRDMEKRQQKRRAAYEARLIRERRNAVLVKYDGILRKIIAPHYNSGRAFFENVIITGEFDAADIAPFPAALVNAQKLFIKNMKDEQHSVQMWDLQQFPYGRNI